MPAPTTANGRFERRARASLLWPGQLVGARVPSWRNPDATAKPARAAQTDGFNVMSALLPVQLDVFSNAVNPILQRRGLFRTE